MKILVLGGPDSGKSRLAEEKIASLAAGCGGRLIYVATLDPNSGGDTPERIERHRRQREKFGFATIEAPRIERERFKGILNPKESCVLFEDLGNLIANELFPPPDFAMREPKSVARAVRSYIGWLCARCAHIVLVANKVEPCAGEPVTENFCAVLEAALSYARSASFELCETCAAN